MLAVQQKLPTQIWLYASASGMLLSLLADMSATMIVPHDVIQL